MVNANGYPTRAHARDGGYAFNAITIDSKYPLLAPDKTRQRDLQLTNFKTLGNHLSPATKRILNALRSALTVSYEPRQGYRFAPYVNRVAIAHQLGRDSLVPYDIRMLRLLASKKLIVEEKRALPRKQYGEIWLGAGAEFVYAIPEMVLFCLLAFDANEKRNLAELANLANARARAQEAKAKLEKQTLEFDRYSKLLRDKPQEKSILKKLVDWFSW